MSSRLQNQYESDGSDYVEFSEDEKSDSDTEYLTESEHELSSYDSDEDNKSTGVSEDNEDLTFSEPESEQEEEDTEILSEDELSKKIEEGRQTFKLQEIPTELLENPDSEPSPTDNKDATEKEAKEDDKTKTERDEEANEGKDEYPKEILEFLEEKKREKVEEKANNNDKNKETEEVNEEADDKLENKADSDEIGKEIRAHKKHLYTEVIVPTRKKYWISVPQAEKHDWSCNDSTKLMTLRPYGKFGHREYRIITGVMEKTRRRHNTGSYSGYEVLKIQKVINPCLWRNYRVKRKEIRLENEGDANEMMLFHGSPAWRAVVKTGMDERYSSIDGMFGAGLYFAENSSKSNQYVFGFSTGNLCPTHKDRNCMICERVLLLCRVILGNMHQVTRAVRLAHAPQDCHSVRGIPSPGGLRYSEYIVYRCEQVYPEYIITYKLKP